LDLLRLYTRLGTASNYSAIADLHNSQITTALAKSFLSCCVFTSRSLATACNSGDSSASCGQVLPSPAVVQNCLSAIPSTELNRHLFSASLAELNCTQHYQTKSQRHNATDGQSASLSWNKAPIWGLRPYPCYCQAVACLFSLTRGRVCRLQLLLALASAVILGYESRGTRDHILLSQIRDFPFHRLLRLAGSQWRYSTPPPHGIALPNFISLLL
jgi:hypothetical protein